MTSAFWTYRSALNSHRYVEPLSDARTQLADFFSILLIQELSIDNSRHRENQDRNHEHHP